MRGKGVCLAVMAWCCAFAVDAQDGPAARLIYPEDLREDMSVLRQTIEQAHPDPYRYHSGPELDTLFSTVAASFTVPLTAEEFIAAVLPVFKAVGDAGLVLAPPAVLSAQYDHAKPLIPIKVAVIGDRLYLDAELKGFRSLPTGCELVQINGQPAAELLNKLRSSLVPDGADTAWADGRIGQDFPLLYRRFIGASDRFRIAYRTAGGETGERDVFAMTKEEMQQTYARKGIALAPWRLEEMPDLHAAWLTLETMDRKELEQFKVNPERFLNGVGEALRKSKASTLVVDVRGAGGWDMRMAGQVFGLIARKPYRVVRSMSIRSGEVPDAYRYAETGADFFASAGGAYLPEVNGRRELKADDPRLVPVPPQKDAFDGKVYVVADGLTTGAGAAFVMMANRSGRARTVGGETGSNAVSFCGGPMLTLTLPHTDCILRVPLVRFVPEGNPDGPTSRGEFPASPVAQCPQDVAQGKDTVREALLQLIFELQ